ISKDHSECKRLRSRRARGHPQQYTRVSSWATLSLDFVIPGRAKGARPESITTRLAASRRKSVIETTGVMDSGLAAARRPGMTNLLLMALFTRRLLRGRGFLLVLRLPLLVRHAVDRRAARLLGKRHALFVGGVLPPVRQAVAAEAREIHQVDVLHVGARAQVLDQAAEHGGLELGLGFVVHNGVPRDLTEDKRAHRAALLILQRQADVVLRDGQPAGARGEEIIEFCELHVALERRVARKAV